MSEMLQMFKDPRVGLGLLGFTALGAGALLWYLPNTTTRLVAVGCIVGIALLVMGVQALFRIGRRRKAKAIEKGLESEAEHALEVSPAEQRARVGEIRRRFAEAVDELRRAKKSIYDLPWYLLIGEPQSGKSMTLRGSDLNFPIGTDKLSGLGGTQNCDWWFTNQAVILDTAGRFTFQEMGAPDRAEWEGFLDMLSKRRKQCPINGVLVVVPTDALLNDAPEVRKDKAKNMHAKLGELQTKLGVQFPVFVLITKGDLILGFSEFFRSFGEVDAAQIIGWSREGRFDQAFDAADVERGFEQIYQRMCQHRLELLREPVSIEERGLIYEFPEEFRTLRDPLMLYLSTMFAEDIFHEPLFFRGFYLTSGMQEGLPIVTVGREILGGGPPVEQGQEFDPLGKLFPSRPFFIADFYREKALRESGMVFRSAAAMRRGRVLKRLTIVGGAALGVLLAAGLTFGAWRINGMIRKPLQQAHEAHDLITNPEQKPDDPHVSEELETLDSAAKGLASRGWWFATTFPFRDSKAPARDLTTIRDAVFARYRLRPLTERLVAKLSDQSAWAGSQADAARASVKEYVRWYAGQVPGLGDTTVRASAFDRLYTPAQDDTGPLGAYIELRKLFADMGTEFSPVRPWAFGDAAGVDGVEKAIRAAGSHFKSGYASETGRDLRPWVALLQAGALAEQRYHELLGLRASFADVRLVKEYTDAVARWKQSYAGTHDAPGFVGAVAQMEEALKQITVDEERADSGTRYRLRLPDEAKIRQEWYAYFGEPNQPGPDTLYTLIRGASLADADRTKLTSAIDAVLKDLDTTLAAVVKRINEENARYTQYLYEAQSLAPNLAEVERLLAGFDAALNPQRTARIGPALGLESWPGQLPPPLAGELRGLVAVPSGESPDTLVKFVDALRVRAPKLGPQWNWQGSDIAELGAAVGAAVQRHQWYTELTAIESTVSEGQLEKLLQGWDEAVPKDTAGYTDVPRCDLRAFLQSVLGAVEGVEVQVRAAQRETSSLQRGLDAGTQPDPAVGANSALEKALAGYGRRYFDAWRRYYLDQHLDGYGELMALSDWSTYAEALDKPPAQDIYRQAERCLLNFGESVLEVEKAPLSTDQAKLGEVRGEHNRLLAEWRDQTEGVGPRFRVLADSLQRGRGGEDRLAPSQRLSRDASDAFVGYRNSVRQIGVVKDWQGEARGGRQFADLDSKKLDDLQKALSDERILQQLEDVARRGRYCLNVRLNQELQKLIGSATTDTAAFPFRRPAAGDKPPELTKQAFETFLNEVLRFQHSYGQIAPLEGGAATSAPGDRPVGRQEFLGRVEQWARFLYGGSQMLNNLSRGESRDVRFTIQYVEPQEGTYPRVSEEDYTKAALSLGRVVDRSGSAVAGALGDIVFDLLARKSPVPPATLLWKFGEARDVTLTLRDPPVGAQRDPQFSVPGARFAQTQWALPLFIYRYADSGDWKPLAGTGGTGPAQRVWPVLVDVDVTRPGGQTAKVYARFEIIVEKCGEEDCTLPPPIGTFAPQVDAPAPLAADSR